MANSKTVQSYVESVLTPAALADAKRRARGKGLDDVDADDAVQDAAVYLCIKLLARQDHSNPDGLFRSKTKYSALDIVRKRQEQLQSERSLSEWDSPASYREAETGEADGRPRLPEPLTAPDPYEELAEREEKAGQMADVWAVVREFPQKKQYVFEQCMLQERSQQEVAKEVGLAYGTVRNYVSWVEQTLRDRFQRER